MNQKSSLREVPQFVSGVLTANSLIALLPRHPGSRIPLPGAVLDVGNVAKLQAFIPMIFIYVIIAIFMMGAQWIAASRQTPAQVDNAVTPASSAVLPQKMPPPNSVR